ncbi:MAG: tandem-95 repeat protein [Betaproteobacteria bacterium]
MSGNLLSNDLVPIGYSKSLFSARVGNELAATPTYTAITGTSISSFTGAHGTLRLSADGRYEYTVTTTLTQPDTVVEDAFSYRQSADGTNMLADTARYDFGSLVIRVSNRNDPPVVQLLQGEVFEQGIGVDPLARDKAAFNLLRAGTDPEGAALQLGSVSFKPQVGAVRTLGAEPGAEILGEFGTLKRVGLTGEFVYTLDQTLADFLTANDTRTEVFTFSLSDGVKSTSSSVVVTIRGADDAAPTENRAPVGFDKTIIIQEDTAYTFKPAEDFLFRDPNPQDTLAKVRIVQRPSSTAGTLTLDGQPVQDNQLIDAAALNKLVFTPAANVNGSEVAKFTFRVVDAGGLESAPAKTIAFDIKAVNDAPVGTADTLAATEDTPVTYTAAQLVGNDTDVDGDTLSIKSVTAVTGGTVLLNTNGSVQFTPTANFNGAASFSYVATDGKLDTAATSVAVSVSAVNDAPVNSVPAAQTVNEDTNLSITGLAITDVDAGSGSVTVTLDVTQGTITVLAANGVTLGTNGTSSVTLSGTVAAINTALAAANGVVYRGPLNYNGSATLTMTTSDAGNTGSGGALSDIDTVLITVAAVNDRPVFATNLVSKFSLKEFAVGSTPPAGQPSPHGVLFTASASDPDGSVPGGLIYSIVLSPPANIRAELSSPSLYEDGALFRINALTGAIEFIRNPITPGDFSREFSFELDLDKNGDGIFRLVIEVSDGTLREYLPIEITLQNVDEDGTVELFRVNQGSGETKLAANAIVRQGDVLQARLVEPDEFSVTGSGSIDYGESYEWFADGVKILRPLADVGKPTLTVTDSLIGRKISVRVSYSESLVFGSGIDTENSVSSVTLGSVQPANAAPTLIPTTGSLGSVTVTVGSAMTPFNVKPFFADDGGVAQLTFTIRDSTGAALPDGLSIGADGFLAGTPQAGWISAQPRTLFVTATDQGGASVTGTLTVQGQVANGMSGIYVTSAQVGMVDFSGATPTESRSSTIGQFGADAAAPGKARLSAVISGVSDGAPVGADLDRGNLLNLLDANPATGGVPYITMPVISTLAANSTPHHGKLALKLVLQGVLDVNTEVNVSLVTDPAGVARIVVVGDQTALAGLVSFKNGDELGRTISSDGRTLMRIDLLALLDKGITASGKSILAGVVTDDLEASFSVGFVGLPMYTPTGVALSGVDASIVVDDTPNRAPSIVMPHGPANGPKKLAVSMPAGPAVGVGALLADLDTSGGLFPVDGINDVNGDQLRVLLSQPTSGQLIYRGDVVIFPSASGAGQSDFVWGGNAWLGVPIADIGLLEYRSGSSANVPAGTVAEFASMQVVVADSFRAMSLPATVDISIAAKPVDTVLAAAGGTLSLVSVPGVTTIGSLGISDATVMAVPSPSIGKLSKGTVSGTTLVNAVEVKVGDTISASDRFGFTPATSASGAFRDDLLLQQAGPNGVTYLRIDFGLAAVGTDTLDAVTVTSSANVVNVLDAGQIIENAQIPTGGVRVANITSAGTYNYSLSGPDASLFTRVSDQQGTYLVYRGGSPDYEAKNSYTVRVNADNPSVGPQGSVETFVDYTLRVKNVADTIELASNTVRLTDFGPTGAARPMATVAGEFTSIDGRNVLNFSTGSTGGGLSRINLQRLFDGNPATGKAPIIGFDLGDLSAVTPGTHRLQVSAEMQAAGLGDALPLRISFPVDVLVSRAGSVVSLSLPVQQAVLQLSAGDMALGTLRAANLDSDLFSLSQSNSSPAQLAMKLDSLLDKSENDKVALASLGQGGTLAFAGAIAVSALADKSLGELVTLVRDTAAVPSEMRNTTLGRMIDLLQNTVTVPPSLSTMKFDQALSLGAKLVLPEAMGSSTLSSVIGLGVKVLGLPAEIDSVGEVLKVLRDAVELPPSLRGTLGSLKDALADTQPEYQLLDRMESLVRGLLSTNGVAYQGSLSNKTIPQLLDMMASSQMGSMSLSTLSTMTKQSFGGYTVPEVLRLSSDIVGNFYGDLTMNQILSKSTTAITLPSSSSSLGNLSVGELLDVAQAVVVLGGVLQGNDSLVSLFGSTPSAASLENLIQDSGTVDGRISGRSLANVLEIANNAFNIGQYRGAGEKLSDLINDLRNDQVDVGMMTSLASRALFSDQGVIKVRVDLPPALGLLDEFDRPLQSIQVSADVAPPVSLAVPASKQGVVSGSVVTFGKFLRAGTVSDADNDGVKGVWVTDPSTGGDLKLGSNVFANGERKFVPFGGQSTSALDLEDLQFVPTSPPNTSVALQYVVEDTRGALSLPVTYQYVI